MTEEEKIARINSVISHMLQPELQDVTDFEMLLAVSKVAALVAAACTHTMQSVDDQPVIDFMLEVIGEEFQNQNVSIMEGKVH